MPAPVDEQPAAAKASPNVAYWRANLVVIVIMMLIWAVVSFGCSVFFVEPLNAWHVGSLPLGFWFGHQGAMYVFVVLVFAYALIMDQLDKKYGVKE
ncbi:DUF4212 domain-containing protein [Blastopirellula marina]|uniref:DUF4212 domain-containing protein n=1 Tax=Blastopirellula marina TaxID=124 RepID=A0A2S8GR94_9BACT|nr:DUF4212 domain-containing protein [Blastopirellula marina]PQO46946.1 DUF4212 domain-containing protein [Blastopirellula marina]